MLWKRDEAQNNADYVTRMLSRDYAVGRHGNATGAASPCYEVHMDWSRNTTERKERKIKKLIAFNMERPEARKKVCHICQNRKVKGLLNPDCKNRKTFEFWNLAQFKKGVIAAASSSVGSTVLQGKCSDCVHDERVLMFPEGSPGVVQEVLAPFLDIDTHSVPDASSPTEGDSEELTAPTTPLSRAEGAAVRAHWPSFNCTLEDGGGRLIYYEKFTDGGRLELSKVAADGHCFYHALALGKDGVENGGKDLRKYLSGWAEKHQSDNPVVSEVCRLEDLPELAGAEDWPTWLRGLNGENYGSSAEIMLAANACNINIYVFSVDTKDGDSPSFHEPELKFRSGVDTKSVYLLHHWSLDGEKNGGRHFDLLVRTDEHPARAANPDASRSAPVRPPIIMPGLHPAQTADAFPVARVHPGSGITAPPADYHAAANKAVHYGHWVQTEAFMAVRRVSKSEGERLSAANGEGSVALGGRPDSSMEQQLNYLGDSRSTVVPWAAAGKKVISCNMHDHGGQFNLKDNAAPIGRLVFPGDNCYFEGDILDSTEPHGFGSMCMGDNNVEIYRGKWHRGKTTRDDLQWSGAVKGSCPGDLWKLYATQDGVKVRAWFRHPDSPATEAYYEISRVDWPAERSYCFTKDDLQWSEKSLPAGVEVLPGEHFPGSREEVAERGIRDWSVAPRALHWIAGTDRPRYAWPGATCVRHENVRQAMGVTEDSDGLSFCTAWASADLMYPWYESLMPRGGKSKLGTVVTDSPGGRNQSVEMAMGVWDENPVEYLARPKPHDRKVISQSPYHMYEWGHITHPHNAVAVMFAPYPWRVTNTFADENREHGHMLGTPHVGAHATCQVFFSLAHLRKSPRLLGNEPFAAMFSGRPVCMPYDWAETYFGDHWRAAKECPNVPVLLALVRDRRPLLNPRTVQLVDPLLLLKMQGEDRLRSSQCSHSDVSIFWAELERRRTFGFLPILQQVALLGLRDCGFICSGEQTASGATDRTEGITLSAAPWVQAPHSQLAAVDAPDDNVRYLAGRTPRLEMVQSGCLLNLFKIKYMPGHGKTPFLIELHPAHMHRFGNFREEGLKQYVDTFYAVSFTFLRRYYHAKVLLMAVKGEWDATSFIRNDGGPMALLAEAHNTLCTAPDEWIHRTPKEINIVGSHAAGVNAGCGAGTLVGLLQAFTYPVEAPIVDDGACEYVREKWSPWVAWNTLPDRVATLDHCSTAQRRYLLIKVKDVENSNHQGKGRSIFNLVTTPAGRNLLYGMGVRHLLLRPVFHDGWGQHVLGLTADESGVWRSLDPNDGGEGCTSKRLYGCIPGVRTVRAAYVLITRPAAGGPCLPTVTRKEVPRVGRKNGMRRTFVFPPAPTDLAARRDYMSLHVLAAFNVCCDLRLPHAVNGFRTIENVPTPSVRDDRITNHAMWGLLVREAAQPINLSLEVVTKAASLLLRSGPVGGRDGPDPVMLLVETAVRGGMAGVNTVFLVVVHATSHRYYCPHDGFFKDVTSESLGLLTNKHLLVYSVGLVSSDGASRPVERSARRKRDPIPLPPTVDPSLCKRPRREAEDGVGDSVSL